MEKLQEFIVNIDWYQIIQALVLGVVFVTLVISFFFLITSLSKSTHPLTLEIKCSDYTGFYTLYNDRGFDSHKMTPEQFSLECGE